MEIVNRFFYISCFVCLAACGQKLGIKNSDIIKEDRFLKRIKVGNTEAIAKLQNGDTKPGSNDFIYFNVKFNKTDASSFNKEKILYLNFDMQNDFVLLKDRDSISPAFCQRIENGMKNNFEYIIAFEKDNVVKEKTISLIYKDKIFSIGTVAFIYN